MTANVLNDLNSAVLAETALGQNRRSAPGKPARLWKGLTMLAAAAAVVLVGTAPMQADEDSDNLAKIIVGGLIVGAIVNDMKHRDGDRPQYDDGDYYGSGDYYDGDRYKARDRHRRSIPQDCAITIDSRDRGRVTLYGGRCLRDYGYRNLPDCGRSVRIYGQRDKLFSAQCLRRAGFGGSRMPRSSDHD